MRSTILWILLTGCLPDWPEPTDSGSACAASDEVCDGADNDCDGAVDEAGALDAGTWYADADGDSFGDPAASERSCVAGDDHVADSGDCDDGDGAIHPGATEDCDRLDNDCDEIVDESWSDPRAWFQAPGGGWIEQEMPGSAQTVFNLENEGTLRLCGQHRARFLVLADVTIEGGEGAGAALDGSGEGTVVEATGATVELTLRDLTIRGGAGTCGGGVFAYELAAVAIEDVTIENNAAVGGEICLGGVVAAMATGCGGAVHAHDVGDLQIADSRFALNSASSDGGALCLNDAGGAMTGLTVSENTAGGGGGGAWFLSTTGLTIEGSAFSENYAAYNGGGLAASGLEDFEISDTRFEENVADVEGGGVYIDASRFALSGATFADNTAGTQGGALVVSRTSGATVDASSFSENEANNGGAIYLQTASTIALTKSRIEDNEASHGAGIYAESQSAVTFEAGCEISGNQALGGYGGGVLIVDSEVWGEGTVLADNAAAWGAGLCIDRSDATMDGATLSGNQASQDGGGFFTLDSDASFSNCSFSKNAASSLGGGMFIAGTGEITGSACTFEGNTPDDAWTDGTGWGHDWEGEVSFDCDSLDCTP